MLAESISYILNAHLKKNVVIGFYFSLFKEKYVKIKNVNGVN